VPVEIEQRDNEQLGCVQDSECVMAVNHENCCPGCPTAVLDFAFYSNPCIVAPGEPAPEGCGPVRCGDSCPVESCAADAVAICVDSQCYVGSPMSVEQ